VDVERLLVTKMAKAQSMELALARQIEPHHFHQRAKGDTNPAPLPGEVYSFMLEHLRRFKSVPSFELVRRRWPRFEFLDDGNSIDAIVVEMVKAIKYREAVAKVRLLAEAVDDPTKWEDLEIEFFSAAADLARAVPTSSVTRLSDSIHRLKLHQEMQRTGKAPGITLGTSELDALTYGIQPGELLIWEGFLGVGKSTQAMIQSATEYLEGKTSLVLSLEMEAEKLANRWDAAMSGFHYKALKFSEMSTEDYDKWMRFAERAYEARFEKDVIVRGDIHHPTSEIIFAEVERWRPDFFIVDTVDELRAPAHITKQGLYQVARHAIMELKGICRATKVPGVGVAQAGREAEEEGAKLSNIAGAIDIARKADIVIGLHATPQMKRARQLELRALKNRDGEGDGLSYMYYRDPATLTLRPWTPADSAPPPPPPVVPVPAGPAIYQPAPAV
jgi:replicative DNA helicase